MTPMLAKMQSVFTIFLLLATALAPRAWGAVEPHVAASIADSGARAWSVYRNSQGEHLLVFIAPRDGVTGGAQSTEAAEPGQVQAMRPLGNRNPLRIAAQGERVFLVYPPVYANGERLMRVYSASALPGNVGGMWLVSPQGRLETQPPILTDAELIDLQSTSDSLYVLLRNEDDSIALRRLDASGWVPVSMPDGINDRRLDLTAMDSSLVLVDRAGPAFHAHVRDSESESWSVLPDSLPIGRHTQILAGQRALGALDWDEQDLARLRVWSDAGLFTIVQGVEGVPQDATYALLETSDTLLGLRAVESDGETQQAGVELIELDSTDLSVRYAGPPVTSAPVSVEEFRFLVMMMILVMLGVLVVVILPDRSEAMRIPEACVLADPGRRLIATMLDAVIVASVVGWVFEVSVAEILTLTVIVRPDSAWGVIPATIITGALFCTLNEWLLGYTPGKLLMGIRVVRARHDVVMRPKLWSALVRNSIKWILPPVAALALIDPESLHRGDRSSRSIVVMPRRETPTPPSDEG